MRNSIQFAELEQYDAIQFEPIKRRPKRGAIMLKYADATFSADTNNLTEILIAEICKELYKLQNYNANHLIWDVLNMRRELEKHGYLLCNVDIFNNESVVVYNPYWAADDEYFVYANAETGEYGIF